LVKSAQLFLSVNTYFMPQLHHVAPFAMALHLQYIRLEPQAVAHKKEEDKMDARIEATYSSGCFCDRPILEHGAAYSTY
jgi:hypothetical protein